ncbi:restriction endonuclease [Lacticaseibacillus saniviri]|uniref:Mrr-like endonuclease n=1 Tax=Lacticaseibacillus saniviri JCM 17471 = DSM 24301 TaxID=1293598 RepID=A0A0R2MR83_9LACO|nr:restriction endonuclease [Lacticaseibacillus saniviri]KRO16136.1 Mrr-like endonuclease [Lacticaseibacillus saniviri JCM 17471 = DSM 24301]MCG4282126.1 restriction endonuclease [Lacticaseibacillus saniviri]
MRRLGKRLYRLFVFGFIAALAYSLWLRQYAPGLWRQKLDPMSFGLIVAFVLFSAAQLYFHHFRYRDVKLEQIDSMDGEAFEHFCGYLLKRNGYKHIEVTQYSGDQGIDIIAQKKGQKFGIQCKRYSGFVGNKAVQEVWAGKEFYKLDQAIVLTNSEFSDSAQELAEQLGVTLIDRNGLRRLMRRLPG